MKNKILLNVPKLDTKILDDTSKIEQSPKKRKHTGEVCAEEQHKRQKTLDVQETKEMSTKMREMSDEKQGSTARANFKSTPHSFALIKQPFTYKLLGKMSNSVQYA